MKIVSLREGFEVGKGDLPFPAGVEIRRFSVKALHFVAIFRNL